MKNILIGSIAVVLILFVSFFALNSYIYNEKQATGEPVPTETLERELVGVVTGVDVTGVMVDGPALIDIETEIGESHSIAVPSMGINLCPAAQNIANVYDVAIGDVVSVRGTFGEEKSIVPCNDASHYLQVVGVHLDTEVGFRFEYPKGPDGYLDTGEGFTFSDDPSFIKGIMLVNKKEYEAMKENTEPREGPPTIQIQVYRNPERQQSAVWLDSHPQETNINLAVSEPGEASVGGVTALRFTADGLYASDVYVVTVGEYVFLLRGEYIDKNSDIYRTFTDIVDNFEFIPTGE